MVHVLNPNARVILIHVFLRIHKRPFGVSIEVLMHQKISQFLTRLVKALSLGAL